MKEAPEVIKQKLSRFYDQEAQGYHKIHYRTKVLYSPLAQRQKYIENMVEEVRTPRGAKVLDVGCGPGELVLSLLSLKQPLLYRLCQKLRHSRVETNEQTVPQHPLPFSAASESADRPFRKWQGFAAGAPFTDTTARSIYRLRRCAAAPCRRSGAGCHESAHRRTRGRTQET